MAVIARLYRLRGLGKRGESKGGVQNVEEDDEYGDADRSLRHAKARSAPGTKGRGSKGGIELTSIARLRR